MTLAGLFAHRSKGLRPLRHRGHSLLPHPALSKDTSQDRQRRVLGSSPTASRRPAVRWKGISGASAGFSVLCITFVLIFSSFSASILRRLGGRRGRRGFLPFPFGGLCLFRFQAFSLFRRLLTFPLEAFEIVVGFAGHGGYAALPGAHPERWELRRRWRWRFLRWGPRLAMSRLVWPESLAISGAW